MNYSELMIKAATDEEFRGSLLADPRAVLTEQGLNIPDDVTVRVEESTTNELVFVIPPALPDDVELDEEALAGASGGTLPLLLGTLIAAGAAVGGAVGGYELVKHI